MNNINDVNISIFTCVNTQFSCKCLLWQAFLSTVGYANCDMLGCFRHFAVSRLANIEKEWISWYKWIKVRDIMALSLKTLNYMKYLTQFAFWDILRVNYYEDA